MSDFTPDLTTALLTERTQLTIPSLPSWIEPTVDFLCRKAVAAGACPETRAGKLTVALHEGLSNALIHGNLGISSALKERDDNAFAEALARQAADPAYADRRVAIAIDLDRERCAWTITDEGAGFDVDKVLERCQSQDPDLLRASGRGLLMMRAFVDEVRYEQGGRRLILTQYRASASERRYQDRRSVQAPLRVVPLRADGSVDWAAAQEAIARNVSANGIGILQQQLETAGQILIGIVHENEMMYVPAEIRHCRPLAEGNIELGCRFLTGAGDPASLDATRADTATMQAAIDRMLAPDSSTHLQQRAQPRYPFAERVNLFVPGQAEIMVGFARDLSRSGIALVTRAALPPEFTVAFVARTPPLHLRARLIRCVKITEGFYDVGARFLGVSASN